MQVRVTASPAAITRPLISPMMGIRRDVHRCARRLR
jgi:hypothetical protein